MALIFETVQTEGIAELSYLIGDDEAGVAAVIDPRPDVEIYLELAQKRKVSITHILETHIHADLMSGSCELSARVKTASIYVSTEGRAKYAFEHVGIKDGELFKLGSLVLTARHTPGHTPEHMAYEAAEKKRSPKIWGIFTGDSLFVNSAGRPDLMGDDQKEVLAERLHETLYKYYLSLEDNIIIYPTHGHGSPCGADIGDRLTSSIGYERRFNPFLQIPDMEKFKEYALSSAPPEPTYYKPMKVLNAKGPEILGGLPTVAALPAKGFQAIVKKGKSVIVDTRAMLAFGGGHIPSALNIGGSPELSIWAGWFLDPDQSILLVLEDDKDVPKIVPLFLRTGFTKFDGYLVGGMKAWDNAAYPIDSVSQITVHELNDRANELQIVDVRSPAEFEKGHIPGAIHIFLPDLKTKSRLLKKRTPTAVYCDSGYRASLGTSILQPLGFDVMNVPGSWQAWKNGKFPVESAKASAA